MTDKQPEALRLADWLDAGNHRSGDAEISAELRRLHAANLDCVAWFNAVKAERDVLLAAMKQIASTSAIDSGRIGSAWVHWQTQAQNAIDKLENL